MNCIYIYLNGAYINYNNVNYIINISPEMCTYDQNSQNIWVILIIAKIFAKDWKDARIKFHTNSSAITDLINTGVTRHGLQMTLARNLWLVSAIHQFNITAGNSSSWHQYSDCHIIPASVVEAVNKVYLEL
jgi:hypothetical protein